VNAVTVNISVELA